MLAPTLRLAVRNLTRHRGRTALSIGAIAFGVAGLIVTGGFVEDVFVQLAEATIHSQLGHVQVARRDYFGQGAGRPADYLIEAPAPLMRRLAALPGVDDALSRVRFSGLLNNGRADLAIVGEGVEPDKETRLGTYLTITAGRPLAASDRFGMLIGQGAADTLRLKPGDVTTLVVNTEQGAVNTLDFTVIGVFRSFSRDFDARAVRIGLPAAQELLAVEGVNTIVLVLRETGDTAMLAQEAARTSGSEFEIKTWTELSDFYIKTRALYERQFRVLELIVLCLIILSVLTSINMTVAERIGEFGTMRALGNTGRDVFRLVLVECAMLGIGGSALGVVLGVATALTLSSIGIPMPPPPNADVGYTALVRLEPSVIALAFATGAISSLLASVLPARRAARIPIVIALRQNV